MWINILQHFDHYDASAIENACGVECKDTFREAGAKIAKKLSELNMELTQLREERE